MQFFKKLILSVFLLGLLFSISQANALVFKAGDQAAYTISEKVDLEVKNIKAAIQSDATLDLTIKILSTNPETLSYPFEVEVILKKIVASESAKIGKNSKTFKYNSESSKNASTTQEISKILNVSMLFRVDGPFQVEETTGYLTKLFWEWDSSTELDIFGTHEGTYVNLLTQLFHLSGEDLVLTHTYPVNCFTLLEWDDPSLEDGFDDAQIKHSSSYKINKMDTKAIHATWEGYARQAVTGYNANLVLKGDVNWNIKNPMIQQRKITANLEAEASEELSGPVKVKITQIWTSTPL